MDAPEQEAAAIHPDALVAFQMSGRAIARNGRVDPATADVAQPPKRHKARSRPAPTPDLAASEATLERRARARSVPPGVILEPAADDHLHDKEHWTAPHSEIELWHLQLADAFGTRSASVIHTFMSQLEQLCGREVWDDEAKQWRMDEHEFNAALATVNSVRPRNEIEAGLAAQMVAVHMMTLKLSARALKYPDDARTAATAGKLARTYVQQLDAFQRLRGRQKTAKQSIKVSRETHHHQHVHVHRGDTKDDGQPHGRNATIVDQGPTLPGEEPGGQVVPLPSRKRQVGV